MKLQVACLMFQSKTPRSPFANCQLPIAYYFLLHTAYWLLHTSFLLPTAHCLLTIAKCSLHPKFLLLTAYWLLLTSSAYCILFAAYFFCLLPLLTAYYLL